MSERDDDRERERPSWRELDKMRDRSRHTRPERREPTSRKARATSQAAKQAYIKKLDEKLFGGKTPGRKAADALREARGTRGFPDACDAYVAEHGFPDAADLLLLFLDHENSEVVIKAMERLSVHAREKRVDADALAKALRRVKVLTDDPDVESRAEELLSAL
jgi:hypothetical protein